MVEHGRPPVCPIMRKLIAMLARIPPAPGLQDHGRLIDRLTDLEAEGVAGNAPPRTLEAIRATRLQIRVASLLPRRPSLRGS